MRAERAERFQRKGRTSAEKEGRKPLITSNLDDEPFVGCTVRMLKSRKEWSIGDIFTITGSSEHRWTIDGGLHVAKKHEGTWWEWSTSPSGGDEEEAESFVDESLDASHAGLALESLPPHIAKRQKIRHDVQILNTDRYEPCAGMQVRMLRSNTNWKAGDVLNVASVRLHGGPTLDNGRSLCKELEGKQWEWATSPAGVHEERTDSSTEESFQAPHGDAGSALGSLPLHIAKRQKIRHDIQIMNAALDEPCPGMQVRMLRSTKHWKAGDVFTVASVRLHGGLTLDNGRGLGKAPEGMSWERV